MTRRRIKVSDQILAERLTVELRISELTDENFAPYGQIFSRKAPILPRVESGEGSIAIELSHMGADWRRSHLEEMAVHFSYNQTFIVLKGTMIMVVAPAPRNRTEPI